MTAAKPKPIESKTDMNTQTETVTNSNDQLTENSWPRHTVKSIETRKRDLVIRIADFTRTKDAPCFDVEFYQAGVYDWHKSHSFDASMLGKTEAKRRAIAHAQNLIVHNL